MCECGQSEQTVQHMLQCQLLDNPCSIRVLADAMETAMMCVNKWKKRSEKKKTDDGLDKKTTKLNRAIPILDYLHRI